MCEECKDRIEQLEKVVECALEAIDELQAYLSVPGGSAFTDMAENHQHHILQRSRLYSVRIGQSVLDRRVEADRAAVPS